MFYTLPSSCNWLSCWWCHFYLQRINLVLSYQVLWWQTWATSPLHITPKWKASNQVWFITSTICHNQLQLIMDFLIANFFELKEKVLFNKMGKGHHLYGGGFGSSRVKYGGYGSHEPNLIWELSVPNFFLICYLFCFNICFLFWFALCFVWFFSPLVDVLKLFFFLCVNITKLINT